MILVAAVACTAYDSTGLLGPVADSDGTHVSFNPPSDIPYNYANMLKGLPGGEVLDIGEFILFFSYINVSNGNALCLFEYDKRTGEVEYFCKNATCAHNTPGCAAYSLNGNLELVDGTVYAERKIINNGAYTIYMVELINGSFVNKAGPDFGVIRHWGSKAYGQTNDGALIYMPDSGKPETILEYFPHNTRVIVDGYYYTGIIEEIVRIDLRNPPYEPEIVVLPKNNLPIFTTDGTNLYYYDEFFHMVRSDMDGKNQQAVLEWPIWPPSVNFDDEYIYFSLYTGDSSEPENYNLYRMKLDLTGVPELLAELGFRIQSTYTFYQYDKLFLTSQNNYKLYAISKDGTGLAELMLPK